MVNCPNCETEIEEGIKFCTKCGTKIENIQDISQENNDEISCPKCSVKLPAKTKFCMECGTKIENIYRDPNQEITCPKCSVENPAGTRFCTSCGTKLEHVAYSHDQEIICPKCSAKLPAGTRFCTDCGTKFEQISHSNSAVKSQNGLVSDNTVETVKETGKDIMKGVGGLFNKATSKGGLFDKVSVGIDDAVSPKAKTVYKKYLICNKCGGYYELEKGESPNDFDSCQCGGKLKYQLKQEKIPN